MVRCVAQRAPPYALHVGATNDLFRCTAIDVCTWQWCSVLRFARDVSRLLFQAFQLTATQRVGNRPSGSHPARLIGLLVQVITPAGLRIHLNHPQILLLGRWRLLLLRRRLLLCQLMLRSRRVHLCQPVLRYLLLSLTLRELLCG